MLWRENFVYYQCFLNTVLILFFNMFILQSRVPVYITHSPAGTSVQNMIHWRQVGIPRVHWGLWKSAWERSVHPTKHLSVSPAYKSFPRAAVFRSLCGCCFCYPPWEKLYYVYVHQTAIGVDFSFFRCLSLLSGFHWVLDLFYFCVALYSKILEQLWRKKLPFDINSGTEQNMPELSVDKSELNQSWVWMGATNF